jgi:hypothetical protein
VSVSFIIKPAPVSALSQVKITPAVKEKKEKAPGKPKKEKLSFTQGADLFGAIDISLL